MLAQYAESALAVHTTGSASNSRPTLKLVPFVGPTDAACERRTGRALGQLAHRQLTPIRKAVSLTNWTKH